MDKDGNMEVDDLDDDQKSFCEEMDVTDADGKVHHVKKWHHHSMDHFQVFALTSALIYFSCARK